MKNRAICRICFNVAYVALKLAYTNLRHAGLNEACRGGVCIHEGCVILLKEVYACLVRVRLLGFGLSFGPFSNLLIGLTI